MYESNEVLVNRQHFPRTYDYLIANELDFPAYDQSFEGSKNFKVGGARIKEIINKNEEAEVTTTRRFKYENSTYFPAIRSTGKLMS